jgi:hypothetical protein
MRPSEIRRCVLGDHFVIREMLDSIERLAWLVLRGEHWPEGSLRLESEALLDRLRDHIQFEDIHLKPALMASGVLGLTGARQLDKDHRLQRRILEDGLAQLQDDERSAMTLARNLLDLVQLVRMDMRSEEAFQLREDILCDSVAPSPRGV